MIAEKYAVALLQVAQEQKSVDSVGLEIQAIAGLLEKNDELKAALEHPRADRFEKLSALQKLLEEPLSQTMANFLLLLITKKRMSFFTAVADHYERLSYGTQGKAIARVLTALPLTPGEKNALTEKLGRSFGALIEVREQVEPALIGGMMVYLGDQRLDASFLGQLEKMRQQLLKVDA
ncbi:MAG: ATP synthase F1 subunit delta [bacterium]